MHAQTNNFFFSLCQKWTVKITPRLQILHQLHKAWVSPSARLPLLPSPGWDVCSSLILSSFLYSLSSASALPHFIHCLRIKCSFPLLGMPICSGLILTHDLMAALGSCFLQETCHFPPVSGQQPGPTRAWATPLVCLLEGWTQSTTTCVCLEHTSPAPHTQLVLQKRTFLSFLI